MAAWDTAWEAFKAEVGPTLVDEMSAQSPVGDPMNDPAPGTLADSHSQRDGEGDRLEIISTDERGPIAKYVIRGTRPHPIDPVNASMLHWVGDAGDVFAGHVDHPGTDPNPFNQRAWEAQRDEVVAKFKVTVGRGVALAFLNPWRNRQL